MVVLRVEAQGPTLSFPTLTNGDAGVLSACFLVSTFTSVSSLKLQKSLVISLIFAGLQSIPPS